MGCFSHLVRMLVRFSGHVPPRGGPVETQDMSQGLRFSAEVEMTWDPIEKLRNWGEGCFGLCD